MTVQSEGVQNWRSRQNLHPTTQAATFSGLSLERKFKTSAKTTSRYGVLFTAALTYTSRVGSNNTRASLFAPEKTDYGIENRNNKQYEVTLRIKYIKLCLGLWLTLRGARRIVIVCLVEDS